MTVYVCDRCNKPIDDFRPIKAIALQIGGYGGHEDRFDVCDSCFDWFKGQFEEDQHE